MSPTVNPLGKGSSGSTTYWAKPVIHAVPARAGTAASTSPTFVSRTMRPVNVVPRTPSCTKSWPSGSSPLAHIAAILAQVPVPQGERSRAPVQVSGLFQSSLPVETMTVLRRWEPGLSGGAESWPIVTPRISGFSGWTGGGSCSWQAALIISPTRVASAASSGASVSPTWSASAMT